MRLMRDLSFLLLLVTFIAVAPQAALAEDACEDSFITGMGCVENDPDIEAACDYRCSGGGTVGCTANGYHCDQNMIHCECKSIHDLQ